MVAKKVCRVKVKLSRVSLHLPSCYVGSAAVSTGHAWLSVSSIRLNMNIMHAAMPTQSALVLTCKDTSYARTICGVRIALMVKQLMPRPLVFKSGDGDRPKDAIAWSSPCSFGLMAISAKNCRLKGECEG